LGIFAEIHHEGLPSPERVGIFPPVLFFPRLMATPLAHPATATRWEWILAGIRALRGQGALRSHHQEIAGEASIRFEIEARGNAKAASGPTLHIGPTALETWFEHLGKRHTLAEYDNEDALLAALALICRRGQPHVRTDREAVMYK
jgi:hypothetical protein